MRRVVITGLGAVSPCGINAASTWDAIVNGRSGIGPITLFDASEHATKFAGECTGFDPESCIPRKDVRTMDRVIHLALGAADDLMQNVGEIEESVRERTGTFIGVGFCGLQYLENTAATLRERGPKKISPYFIPATIANLAPGQVSMRHRLKGVSYTTTSACSSGAHAIGEGFKWIQRGEIVAAVAGGSEAAVTPLGVGGFNAMRALSKRNDAPQQASRPWDTGRDGFVIAEGSGLVFLEELEHAKARGARIYGEVLGYGATADAYHLTQPAPDGEGAQRAMRMALADAKRDVSEVDYVNAHGTSTPVGDLQELKAIQAVFGSAVDNVWVSSTKSMTGHLLGAAGGLEALICALAMEHSIVPPTINLDSPDPEIGGIDLVPHEARPRQLRTVLTNSFGFGGTNATLVLGKYEG